MLLRTTYTAATAISHDWLTKAIMVKVYLEMGDNVEVPLHVCCKHKLDEE